MFTAAPLVAQIGLSAPRVVVVFDGGEEWHYWARLALHAATRLWGGRGFLLVPHVGGSVEPALLRAARTYDPDYVVLLNTTIGQQERAAPGTVPLPVDGRVVDGEERVRLLQQVSDTQCVDPAGERARQTVAEACSPYRRQEHGTIEERLVSLGLGDAAAPLTPLSAIPHIAGGPYLSAPPKWGGALGVMVAAQCGIFDEPEVGYTPVLDEKERQQLLDWLLSDDSRPAGGPPEALLGHLLTPFRDGDDPHRAGTAFQRTTYGLGQVSFGHRPRNHATFVIGDSAADFAAAHARKLMYGDGWWLPSELSPCGADTEAERIRLTLQNAAVTKSAYRRGRVTVCTISAGAEAVAATVEALRTPVIALVSFTGATQQQLYEKAVLPGDIDFPSSGAMSYALEADLDHPVAIPAAADEDGTVTMLSPTPAPDISDSQLRESPELTWQVEIRPESLGAPPGRGLDGCHLLAPGSDPYLTWVRSGRYGTRFESHRYDFVAAGTPRLSRLARPKLRELSLRQWADCLAGQQEKSVRLSDAGRRAEVLTTLLGGREQLAATFAGPLLPVLRGFLSEKPATRERYPSGEGVVLHAAGTNDAGYEGYLTFDGMKSFDSRDDEKVLAADVDSMVTAGLLVRGIIVSCEVCGRVNFISLDLAGRTITCPRCQASNPLTSTRWRQPVSGPTWYFDLHPVARDLLRDNGEVPLQLAHHLRLKSRRYTDSAEFELCNDSGTALVELDLPAYVDGQVIVAEAKSSRTLGDHPTREAKKKVKAADTFQADQLIFATTETAWESRSLSAIHNAVHQHSWANGKPPALRIIAALGQNTCQDQRMDYQDGQLSPW
ncbi:hypothetical protein [Micromonospora sp. NPDC005313]|uniref:hypothetical protein n=1 Tax=Micromonospora sp. NPDC005313 TaxID=3154296 RepID=UPI0033B388E5